MNVSPILPTVQNWSQNIQDTSVAILRWRSHAHTHPSNCKQASTVKWHFSNRTDLKKEYYNIHQHDMSYLNVGKVYLDLLFWTMSYLIIEEGVMTCTAAHHENESKRVESSTMHDCCYTKHWNTPWEHCNVNKTMKLWEITENVR